MTRQYTRHTPKQSEPSLSATEGGIGAADAALAQMDAQLDREPARASVREEDPRERARRRAAELTPQLNERPVGMDKFAINTDAVPDGWEYEWKRTTTLGARDPAYEVELARNGWEAVPAARHPNEMPVGYRGSTIERDGMILMERPAQISEHFRDIDRHAAREQMRGKEEQLSGAPIGTFERDNSGRSMASVKKSYGPVQIPE